MELRFNESIKERRCLKGVSPGQSTMRGLLLGLATTQYPAYLGVTGEGKPQPAEEYAP